MVETGEMAVPFEQRRARSDAVARWKQGRSFRPRTALNFGRVEGKRMLVSEGNEDIPRWSGRESATIGRVECWPCGAWRSATGSYALRAAPALAELEEA